MKRKFQLAAVALIASSTFFGSIGCRNLPHTSEASAATVPTARVARAQRGGISKVLSLAGQFQPYQIVDVHPKVSGYMKHINVDIGDIVRQGQTIAVLQVPELRAQLEAATFEMGQSKEEMTRAQHEINRAEATHTALHAGYERLKQAGAVRPGLVAQQELDDAQAQDLSAEAQVDSAKAAMAAAKEHMGAANAEEQRVEALENYTNVTAPLDGVVVWRYADTGALIQGGTTSNDQSLPIVRLSQSNLLRLRLPVPEDDVKYVRLGDEVQVRADAIGRSFTGKIARFTRNVNFETRTMETEVDVENKDLSIAPGMYANTMLRLAHVENTVTIPVEAIVLSNGESHVYVLGRGNHIHIRTVQVGLEGSKLAQITAGLEVGDLVLMGGQEQYAANQEVHPLIAETPASETMRQAGGMIDLNAEVNGATPKDGGDR
jgi:RND family efflux transporter MFP subunit